MNYCWPPVLQSPAVTVCTTSLTFTNSTFCPHSVFMCFVWIWAQTAIISIKRKSKFVPVHALKAHTGSRGLTSTQNIVNIQKQRLLPPVCLCLTTESEYFPIRRSSADLCNGGKCVYCEVGTALVLYVLSNDVQTSEGYDAIVINLNTYEGTMTRWIRTRTYKSAVKSTAGCQWTDHKAC